LPFFWVMVTRSDILWLVLVVLALFVGPVRGDEPGVASTIARRAAKSCRCWGIGEVMAFSVKLHPPLAAEQDGRFGAPVVHNDDVPLPLSEERMSCGHNHQGREYGPALKSVC